MKIKNILTVSLIVLSSCVSETDQLKTKLDVSSVPDVNTSGGSSDDTSSSESELDEVEVVDIEVEEIPLESSNVTTNSANLTWNQTNSDDTLQVIISEGLAIPEDCGNSVEIENDGSHTLTMLLPGTKYRIRLCDEGEPTSKIISFTTTGTDKDLGQVVLISDLALDGSTDYFGTGLAVYGNKMATSLNSDNEGVGLVLAYERSNGGLWELNQVITSPEDPDQGGNYPSARFGSRIEMVEDHMILSDPREALNDDPSTSDQKGAIYIYQFDGSFWEPFQKISYEEESDNMWYLGTNMDINKDASRIVASYKTEVGLDTVSAVRLFARDEETGLYSVEHDFIPNPLDEDGFGWGDLGVQVDGPHVAIGDEDYGEILLFHESDFSEPVDYITWLIDSDMWLFGEPGPSGAMVLDNNRLFYYVNDDDGSAYITFKEYDIDGEEWNTTSSLEITDFSTNCCNSIPLIDVSGDRLIANKRDSFNDYYLLEVKILPEGFPNRLALQEERYVLSWDHYPMNLKIVGDEIYDTHTEGNAPDGAHFLQVYKFGMSENDYDQIVYPQFEEIYNAWD